MDSGSDLLSRAVSSQVPSALKGLTAVFGMGTGGTPSSLPPEIVNFLSRFGFRFHSVPLAFACFPSLQFMFSPALRIVSRSSLPVNPFEPAFRFFRCPLRLSPHPDNCTSNDSRLTVQLVSVSISTQIACAKSSPRPISIIKLHMLPHFHR